MSSGEKTEKATPKKRANARQEGQVPKSKELNNAILLLLSFLLLSKWMDYMIEEIMIFIDEMYNNYFDVELSILNFHNLLIKIILFIAKLVAPLMIASAIAGVIINYFQVGLIFTPKVIMPKLNKLNPLSGFKQLLFSKRSLIELLKSILKIVIVVGISYKNIKGVSNKFLLLINSSLGSAVNLIGDTAYSLVMKISAVFLVLGVFDYAYQKWQHEEDLKMTKQEVKEERKQADSSPEVKSKRKQKQREMAMSRMMQAVPQATVVITNPTHLAIAIKFDMDDMEVPIIIAKGQDEVALRIREIAKDNAIEIVEEKPLARALYKVVDIGQEIPMELYQAVAEILAYVYQLDKKGGYK